MTTNTLSGAAPQPGVAELTELEPIAKIRRRWPTWLGAILSILIVAGIGHELFDKGLEGLTRTAPASWLFYLVFVVQLSDVLQYVFGKLLGKHKVAPLVSPSKTVEGLVGGGLENVAVHAQGRSREERIDVGRIVVGHEYHVGLVDGLPAGNRGAVEHHAFIEHVCIDDRSVHGNVLKLAAQVGETKVDIFDAFVLDLLHQIVC